MRVIIEDANNTDRAQRYSIIEITADDMMTIRMAIYDAAKHVESLIPGSHGLNLVKLTEWRSKYGDLSSRLRRSEAQ